MKPISRSDLNRVPWKRVITELRAITTNSRVPVRKSMKRSRAFPRRRLRSFSTRKIILRELLEGLKTRVEVPSNPPMPNMSKIRRSCRFPRCFP
jgi:hypothetical protein